MMASDMDKFLEMSLDEYIATRKNVRKKENKNVSNTAADRRNSKTNDFHDGDEVMENEAEALGETSVMNTSDKSNKSFGIWRGPNTETNYIDLDYMKDEFDEMFNDPELKVSKEEKQNRPKDLRERLNSNSNASNNNQTNCSNTNKAHDQKISKVNRNNWRSNMQTHQNSMSLMSLNTECGPNDNGQFRRRWNNNNNRNFRRRNNDGCGGNRGNGHLNNGSQNINWNYNRNNGGSPNGMYNNNPLSMNNNGRIQRFSQRNSQDNLNKRIKTVLDQINGNSQVFLNKQPGVRDLTIECPSLTISGRVTSGALQTAATQNLQVPATQTQSDLKALLGVNENNLKSDTMAMWAGKLLELFQSTQQQTVHKPIYDMQIQKEIHDLQGKSLLYKCPSGEVVSSDGSGIENCKVTPSSSGVTLNYRFG